MERLCLEFQYTVANDTGVRGDGGGPSSSSNSNNKKDASCTDFAKCSKKVVCPKGSHCFSLWSKTNQIVPSSAGCAIGLPLDDCSEECQTSPKGQNYFCCCTGHLCNMKFHPPPEKPRPTPGPDDPGPPKPEKTIALGHYISALLVVTIVLVAAYIYRQRRVRKRYSQANRSLPVDANNNHHHHHHQPIKQRDRNYLNDRELNELRNNNDISLLVPFRPHQNGDTQFFSNNNNNNHHNQNTTLTNYIDAMRGPNGINHQQLHQQSLSQFQQHQQQQQQQLQLQLINKVDPSRIKLLDVIGRGRFGTVHRATIEGGEEEEEMKEVAVKIIATSDHQSWLNERQVYILPKINHQNILNFLSANDNLEDNSYWLVVEFASKGSLHSFLKDNLVNWNEFLYIALGIVHGLSHLHEADVAHRDFKSKNVLLKHDLTPCITDFGVAAILDTANGSQLDQRKKYLQVGTPRYMAPEVLECSVTFTKSSFTKIDVYALSLVFWELISRCRSLPKHQYSSSSNFNNQQPPNSYLLETVSHNNPYNNQHHLQKLPLYQPQAQQARNVITPPPPPVITSISDNGGVQENPENGGVNTQQYESGDLRIDISSEASNKPVAATTAEEDEGIPPYMLPFEDIVGQNPDINLMRQIVVVDKKRPPIREHWRLEPASEFCRAIEDGWEYDHDARISVSCFVERIESLPKALEQLTTTANGSANSN